jgi:ribosomal-protein-alanine N-acetyltransferase
VRLGWPSRPPAPARIAPLEARHAPRLAEIHRDAFARPWQTQDFERFLAERNVLADGVFAGSDPKPCGFVLSRRVADEAEILSVAVAAGTRGRGYAGALLAHHLDLLTRHGVRTVHLEVEEGNGPALALYRRQNFEEVGRRPGYYAKPDGATAAALTMRRAL